MLRISVPFEYVLVLGFAMFQNFLCVSLYIGFSFNDTAAGFFFLRQLVEGRSKVGLDTRNKRMNVACMEAENALRFGQGR
jgi:hypothetical protein